MHLEFKSLEKKAIKPAAGDSLKRKGPHPKKQLLKPLTWASLLQLSSFCLLLSAALGAEVPAGAFYDFLRLTEQDLNQRLLSQQIEVLDTGVTYEIKTTIWLEWNKIPTPVRNILLHFGHRTHVFSGRSVLDDPRLTPEDRSSLNSGTWDGRSWGNVGASGGNPSASSPTRLSSSFFEGHLFTSYPQGALHEWAHAWDSSRTHRELSSSSQFQSLLAQTEVRLFLQAHCPNFRRQSGGELQNYCLSAPEEAFAELAAQSFYLPPALNPVRREIPQAWAWFHTQAAQIQYAPDGGTQAEQDSPPSTPAWTDF